MPHYPSYPDNNSYGRCLRALEDLERGIVVATADLERTENAYIANHPLATHIHVALMDFTEKGEPVWGKVRGLWRFCNHSCDPNCDITDNWDIVTNRAIKKDEELTTAYDAFVDNFPWPQTWTFQCKCDAINCKRIINSYRTDIVYPVKNRS